MDDIAARCSSADDEFRLGETHRIVMFPKHEMLASSEGLGWRNIYAVVQREAAYDNSLGAVDDHLFVFHLKGSVGIHWSIAGHDLDGRVTPGHYDFFPGREGLDVRLGGCIETMHLYLRRHIVDTVVEDMLGNATQLKLEPVFNGSDLFLEQIAISMRGALSDSSLASKLYVERLSWALAAHLVHSSCHRTPRDPCCGGLSKHQLRRVIEFIEENMENNLSLMDLSSAACLNPVYFGRQFKRTTHMSPHQFVLQRRVDRAKRLLTLTAQPISEVAAACGFCNQEHLHRVFRKQCGTTPGTYRKQTSA